MEGVSDHKNGLSKKSPTETFTQRLWPTLRKEMVRRGLGPIGPQADLSKAIEGTGNPYDKPSEQRYSSWFPEDIKIAERAEIAYYAGCTGAYEAQPMVRGDVIVLKGIGELWSYFPVLLTDRKVLL